MQHNFLNTDVEFLFERQTQHGFESHDNAITSDGFVENEKVV